MTAFQPYVSLENYIGRRLLALLAALAIADIVILFSISMSILLSGMGGGTQEIVRTRAIEVINAQGQPVLIATTDAHQNGVLWVGAQNGQGGVSLSADASGNGFLVVNTASGIPQVSAVASDLEGGGLQIYNADGQQLGFMGASEGGSGHLTLHGTKGRPVLVIIGEDQNSGLLMVYNDLGTNIFLVGAGGNGGVHVNAANAANISLQLHSNLHLFHLPRR